MRRWQRKKWTEDDSSDISPISSSPEVSFDTNDSYDAKESAWYNKYDGKEEKESLSFSDDEQTLTKKSYPKPNSNRNGNSGDVICGDAFQVLKQIPNQKFDLAIVDPPYNIGADKWDRIPNYEQWMKNLFRELQRVSRQQIIFFDYTYTPLMESLQTPHERFIWVREGGFRPQKNGKKLKKGYEPFYWYVTPGKKATFHMPMEKNPYAAKDKRLHAERSLTNVWQIPNLVGAKKERTGHPTQKPLQLIRRIVEMASDRGDFILDPMAGSGTTGVAAHDAGRRYLLIENNRDYCDIIRNRLGKR